MSKRRPAEIAIRAASHPPEPLLCARWRLEPAGVRHALSANSALKKARSDDLEVGNLRVRNLEVANLYRQLDVPSNVPGTDI